MNDESVKNIKFIRPDGTFKIYATSTGSKAYADFKKDFKESTEKLSKDGGFKECKVVVESSGRKSRLSGFKFSDFGMADDFDSDSRTIIIKESIIKDVPDKPDGKSETDESIVEDVVSKDPEPNGFTVELDKKDPIEQVKSLLASMNKYNG